MLIREKIHKKEGADHHLWKKTTREGFITTREGL